MKFATSDFGTFETSRDVRSLVAIGRKASDSDTVKPTRLTPMRHSDERRTICALPFKTAPLNEPADLSIRHCYSMRRRYRAQAAKPRHSPINCKYGRLA